MALVVLSLPVVVRAVEGCAHRVSTMGIRSPVTPRMRRVRRAVPASRAIPATPANRNVQRARDKNSHHSTSRPAAAPAMPRQIKFRRWKGNSLHDCTPPMAKTISPKITPAGHQRMFTRPGKGVDCGASVDMGGVFPPIQSRQALGESFFPVLLFIDGEVGVERMGSNCFKDPVPIINFFNALSAPSASSTPPLGRGAAGWVLKNLPSRVGFMMNPHR